VPVSRGHAQRQGGLGEPQGFARFPSVFAGEGQVVEGGDFHIRVSEGLREFETLLEVAERRFLVAGSAGQYAQHVVGLGQGPRIARYFGQLQSPAGEAGSLVTLVLAVGEQAPVGVEPGEPTRGLAFWLSKRIQGRFVMAPGEIPLTPSGVNVSDLVFECGQVTLDALGRCGFVACERRAVLTGAGPQIPYRLV
jgi:hypothetical protein